MSLLEDKETLLYNLSQKEQGWSEFGKINLEILSKMDLILYALFKQETC
jgi:hypothetical protein